MSKSIFDQVAETVEESDDTTMTPYLFVLIGGFGVSSVSSGPIPTQSPEALCIPIDPECFNCGAYNKFLKCLDAEFSAGINPATASDLARRYLDIF